MKKYQNIKHYKKAIHPSFPSAYDHAGNDMMGMGDASQAMSAAPGNPETPLEDMNYNA